MNVFSEAVPVGAGGRGYMFTVAAASEEAGSRVLDALKFEDFG